ncbi:hypothetical protein SEA_NICEHOUSE_236 [Rhodococcus phage NiceHouse]|nr:hypothetical protein SEA_NICEHOUSE_236 [Rhodococcus phage NiceHouse]
MRFIANFLYSWILPGMIAAACSSIILAIYTWRTQ